VIVPVGPSKQISAALYAGSTVSSMPPAAEFTSRSWSSPARLHERGRWPTAKRQQPIVFSLADLELGAKPFGDALQFASIRKFLIMR
jgi:hypothetical protein